jgi:hypothetical protein
MINPQARAAEAQLHELATRLGVKGASAQPAQPAAPAPAASGWSIQQVQ